MSLHIKKDIVSSACWFTSLTTVTWKTREAIRDKRIKFLSNEAINGTIRQRSLCLAHPATQFLMAPSSKSPFQASFYSKYLSTGSSDILKPRALKHPHGLLNMGLSLSSKTHLSNLGPLWGTMPHAHELKLAFQASERQFDIRTSRNTS